MSKIILISLIISGLAEGGVPQISGVVIHAYFSLLANDNAT